MKYALKYMTLALKQAQIAYSFNEVPIGAIIVKNNIVISSRFNMTERFKNPLKHAEMLVLEHSLHLLNTKELSDCTIYVTIEPCLMCYSALSLAKIGKIVFGSKNPKYGSSRSTGGSISNKSYFQPKVYSGVLEHECKQILIDFFSVKCRH